MRCAACARVDSCATAPCVTSSAVLHEITVISSARLYLAMHMETCKDISAPAAARSGCYNQRHVFNSCLGSQRLSWLLSTCSSLRVVCCSSWTTPETFALATRLDPTQYYVVVRLSVFVAPCFGVMTVVIANEEDIRPPLVFKSTSTSSAADSSLTAALCLCFTGKDSRDWPLVSLESSSSSPVARNSFTTVS
nr:hypothetical protein CFP56_77498 [Quercus suber]